MFTFGFDIDSIAVSRISPPRTSPRPLQQLQKNCSQPKIFYVVKTSVHISQRDQVPHNQFRSQKQSESTKLKAKPKTENN